ncbi:MAG: hypothetical protein WBG71_01835 [Leeuwenhoekiella sp.]
MKKLLIALSLILTCGSSFAGFSNDNLIDNFDYTTCQIDIEISNTDGEVVFTAKGTVETESGEECKELGDTIIALYEIYTILK